jgi:hypothetical protein
MTVKLLEPTSTRRAPPRREAQYRWSMDGIVWSGWRHWFWLDEEPAPRRVSGPFDAFAMQARIVAGGLVVSTSQQAVIPEAVAP